MKGVITTKDLFTSGMIIVEEFGIKAWLYCFVMVLTHKHVTFLGCVLSIKG